MSVFAHFDHTAPAPQKVIGWYDETAFDYPGLPASDDLIALDDAQWATVQAGDPNAWAVSGGALVAYVSPAPTIAQQAAAITSIPSWKIQEVLFAQASPTNAGKTLLDDANTIIASQSKGVQIAWNGGADVSYTSPALAAVCAALSITQASFDVMWVQAAAVSL